MGKEYSNKTGRTNQLLECDKKLGSIIPNIALMLTKNARLFENKIVFQEKRNGVYEGITWRNFYRDLKNIGCNLEKFGYSKGDKVLIFSQNRLEMLEFELAVMASGGVAVPIFFNYSQESAEQLYTHSDAKFLAVGGSKQLERLSNNLPIQHTFIFDTFDFLENPEILSGRKNVSQFSDLLKEKSDPDYELYMDASPDDICLNMYTSGTMGNEKCVQLTHKNILSQQAALNILWNQDENDRFLSYLRWHHSFGGIFEIFNSLYNGALLSLESSLGSDPKEILENWKIVQPTIFFSVPIIYKAIVDMILGDKEAEKSFFHPGLKFVFTAAAPLPKNISDEFEKRNIPVIEGWGLTETSPCCTLTDPKLKRVPGVIGMPIPGVSIKIADDGEILVKGPNVMVGYYKNEKANKDVFTDDGWFCTGDVGELTETGLRLIARKDRIFKLLNAEKVVPTKIEGDILGKCHYISYAFVEGNGRNYPVALLFPNKNLLNRPEGSIDLDMEDCSCPKNLDDLSKCLKNCLTDVNCGLKKKFLRIRAAMLIDSELSVETKTLTPSMKPAFNNVKGIYKAHIEKLYGADTESKEPVYIINLEN